jgi:hypothetical protein
VTGAGSLFSDELLPLSCSIGIAVGADGVSAFGSDLAFCGLAFALDFRGMWLSSFFSSVEVGTGFCGESSADEWEASEAFEGVGRSDRALFEAVERDRFTSLGCSGLAVNRGDAAGVEALLWAGVFLVEGAFAGPFAPGCNEVILGGSAWAVLRLNFEVGGPIEYFFAEEKDDLVDRW